MSTASEPRKLLGVRVTADQHRVLTEAARRERRPVSSFVLQAALKAADDSRTLRRVIPAPRFTEAESAALVSQAQEEFRQSPDRDRNLLEELFAMRREDMRLG